MKKWIFVTIVLEKKYIYIFRFRKSVFIEVKQSFFFFSSWQNFFYKLFKSFWNFLIPNLDWFLCKKFFFIFLNFSESHGLNGKQTQVSLLEYWICEIINFIADLFLQIRNFTNWSKLSWTLLILCIPVNVIWLWTHLQSMFQLHRPNSVDIQSKPSDCCLHYGKH